MPSDKSVQSSDEDTIPEWINNKFFEKILRRYETDETLTVTSAFVRLASGKGENYASIIYRAIVEYSGEKSGHNTGHYIMKTPFYDTFANDVLSKYNIYEHEMIMYKTILPEYHRMLESIGENVKLCPNLVYVNNKECLLVLEDLSVDGYRNADRCAGLDAIHAKMALVKLAKYHAASAVLHERMPNIFAQFNTGMFNQKTDGISPFFLTNLDALANRVAEWPNFESIAEKLRRLRPHLMQHGSDGYNSNKDEINVLTHGDLWTNNMMYLYPGESTKPQDVLLLDFQFSMWSSPATDLTYFFNTSLRNDLLFSGQDELVQFYHGHFTKILRKLQLKRKIPTLHELQIEMAKKGRLAFICCCLTMPNMVMEPHELANFDTIMDKSERSSEYKALVYGTSAMEKVLKQMLPVFDRRGLLD